MLKLKDSGVSTSFARGAVALTLALLAVAIVALIYLAHRFLG
jgi:hypothetical protein